MNISGIREWVLRGAGSGEPPLPDVAPNLVFDNGIVRITDDALAYLTQFEPLTSVQLVTELQTQASVCIVIDGTDPVTGMRHRCAWIFESHVGKVTNITLTTSAQIPEHPHDGRFAMPRG